jgi:hypothetical protein
MDEAKMKKVQKTSVVLAAVGTQIGLPVGYLFIDKRVFRKPHLLLVSVSMGTRR